mmetsp:Transcript_48256/g.92253  ORF Transcript_48256/g.92253 Transcript_48256/m.92253 type:complete len:312 (-) Transcript_48256:649-1584(-)
MDAPGRTSFLRELQRFLVDVRAKPACLDDPELAFFKEFLASWGSSRSQYTAAREFVEPQQDQSEYESGPDLDDECVPPDPDPGPIATDLDTFPDLDIVSKLGTNKIKASEAIAQGNFAAAAEHFGLCLKAVPSALMFAKRAECHIRRKMPVAAVRDCDAAIRLNPDSGKAYKTRGCARRMLGQWDDALKDLGTGLAIDFDEESYRVQRVVEEKISERKYRRNQRRIERDKKRREERSRVREAEREAARREIDEQQARQKQRQNVTAKPLALPPHLVRRISEDPLLQKVFSDPKLMKILAEICAYTFPPGSQ